MTRFNLASVITLVVVVVVVAIAAILLARTVSNAQSISQKAQQISETGRGINTATDSVFQLNRTNQLARSILDSAEPLEGQLDTVVANARSIDGLATSINGTAGTINGTAGDINGTAENINADAGAINSVAGDINSTAGTINNTAGRIEGTAGRIRGIASGIAGPAVGILRIARIIDGDTFEINGLLRRTIGIARDIKRDSGSILTQARRAHQTATCIDRKLAGNAGNDGHC